MSLLQRRNPGEDGDPALLAGLMVWTFPIVPMEATSSPSPPMSTLSVESLIPFVKT